MTLKADEQLLAAIAAVPTTESLVGVFISQTGNIATVDQASSRLQVKSITQLPMRTGDAVRLEWRHGELVLLGPTVPRAVVGRVLVAGNPATVEYPDGSGITATLPVMNGATLAVNDIVFLDWGTNGLVVGRISSPAPPPEPPPPPAGGGGRITRTERFEARDSGAFQAGFGWRTNDVWSSVSNSGGWFYGSKVRDTIPDNADIEHASINLPLSEQTGAAPFGRHDSDSRPGGALTFHDTAALPSKSGEVDIPTSLIDHLKSNAGGLGYTFGGRNVWRGTQRDASSGRLTVTFTYTP